VNVEDAVPAAQPVPERRSEQLQALFAELIGTFGLTFVAAGGAAIAVMTHDAVTHVAAIVAPGLLVMAMIYAIGDLSGAHINPAVTLGFAARRVFPWRYVLPYWAAQLAGAILAAALIDLLFGIGGKGVVTIPHGIRATSLATEIILTFFLVFVILNTATGHKLLGPNAGIAVGATIALDGWIGGAVSDASMNPARSLGPAIVANNYDDFYIYIIGPLLGALIATLCVWLLRGRPKPHEAETATGEGRMA
jgi:aquaporin Z